MTIYQKAIKVRKVCETQSVCENCKYYNNWIIFAIVF